MLRPFIILAALTASTAAAEVAQGPKNVPEFEPAFENQTRAPELTDDTRLATAPVATGLVHPWGIAVLSENTYLVTERIGRLTLVRDGAKSAVSGLPDIAAVGQGGLLDVAVGPDFADTRAVYLTYSKPVGRGAATAAGVGTLSADGTRLEAFRDIFVQDPATRGTGHFGSRIVLDGNTAFITTGDRRAEGQVQDLATGIGKVIRVTTDGAVPAGNPFTDQPGALPSVWSYGHRNMQGAALHPETGELWTLEHGPQGGDELNRIQPGANYGWPIVSYGEDYGGGPIGQSITSADGITEPVYYWDPVIAPGGFAFYTGDLFDGWQGDILAASLNPGALVRLKLDGGRVTGEARYLTDLGRIRDVEVDRDGTLLILTDDPDGAVIRVTPR